MANWNDRIAQNRRELERHPQEDAGRAAILYKLADSLKKGSLITVESVMTSMKRFRYIVQR